MKTSIATMILLIAAVSMIAAEDAPSMWMVQDGNNLDLMVNTSEESSGANAWVYFDPACVNITNVDVAGSPWQPMEGTGWSHQGDHVCVALTNFTGVGAGEYRIASLVIGCVCDNCTSNIEITKAEPVGVIAYNTTYTCTPNSPTNATISMGSGTGTVTLPIIITDAENVGAVDVTLSYDPTVVEVTGVADGDIDCTFTNLEHVSEGWIRVGAIQGENDGLSGQFTLLNVDMVPVSSNTQCDLTLSVTTFKDATPECTAMTYTISNGVYISSKNGDANGDDAVDIADAAYIAKHVIGIAGYETIDEDSADVNDDGIVDMSDSMYLAKHVIGVNGYENLR